MKKILQSLLGILAFVGMTSLTAHAQEPFPSDGSPITSGTVYTVKMFGSYNATFTPSVSGVLIQDGCSDLTVKGASGPTYVGYGSFGQVFNWNVEAGVTYTIYNEGFVWNDGNVSFTMEADQGLVVTNASPAAGGQLAANANGTGYIHLAFNTSVTFDAAYLKVGEQITALAKKPTPDNALAFDIMDAMRALYANGTLDVDGGNAISLIVEGLRTQGGVLYNGDGVLTIDYVAAPKLAEMVSNNVPAQLKSFYPEGDPDGILNFVFDRNLITDGSIKLIITCGNVESESTYYYEEIPATVDGATASVNLTGKLRDLNDYIIYQGSKLVGLKLVNVRDTNGLYAAGQGEGNVGSYPYSPQYLYIEPVNIVSEFTPATGTSLKGVDEVEIWFNNAQIINFDGVTFTYNNGGTTESVNVLNSELNIERTGNEVTIKVAVPEAVKGKDQIVVSLYNEVSLDGHKHDIKAEYDMFVVDLLAPIKSGESIASTGTDDFVFTINRTELYFYIRYDFYNGEGESGWAYGTQLHKQSNGTWTAYNPNAVCTVDFEPYMIVSAYYNENDYNQGFEPAETYKLTFRGTTVPFKFSSVKFESIDPANWATITPTEDFCWTLTFDGEVVIDQEASGIPLGMGMGLMPFDKCEAVDGPSGYSKVWKLYPSYSYLTGVDFLTLNVVAHDMEGMLVEGNTGYEATSSLQFDYSVRNESHFATLTVTPAPGSTVEEISSFVISCSGMAVGPNYSYAGSEPMLLLSRMQEIVYVFTDEDIEVVSDIIGTDELGYPIYDETTKVVVTVNPAVTEEGTYMLIIPENYFTIGSQFLTYGNARFEGKYTIGEGEVSGHQLTVTPEPGEVSALTRIDINAPGIDEATCFGDEDITITDATGAVVYSATSSQLYDASFDWNTWSFAGFYLEPNITDPGVYTLTIPAGFFDFLDGEKSAALVAVYTISTSGISTIILEDADSYTVFNLAGMLVLTTGNAADLSALAPGLYIINGKKVLVK